MINNLLIPLDGSALAEGVLPHAIVFAQAFYSKMTLLRVLDPSQYTGHFGCMDPLAWQMEKVEARNYLESLSARLHTAGIPVNTRWLEGRAAESIQEYAAAEEQDLIVMSSHGRSGISRWNISSVAQKVLQRPSSHTLIVRAGNAPVVDYRAFRYKRILLPLDGSWRAECVLPVATRLAQFCDARLLAIQAVTRPEMVRRMPPTAEDISLADRVMERNREEALDYLAQLPSRVTMDCETHLLEGDTAPGALHQFVSEQAVDLVIMCAHGASGTTQWPYGSIATSFIVYGSAPVLIVQDTVREHQAPLHEEIPITRQHYISEHA
ncbi:MAG: universal stress protein [Chloroflexi bacterium]|nr:universal stress protein [Chloroflexota bacterium]MCL5275401.1 universal stress protein [Chloroflexota bacterium]